MGTQTFSLPALLAASLVAGCASTPVPVDVGPLFEGAHFEPRQLPAGAGQVFALSTPMQDFLQGELANRVRHDGAALALFEAVRDDLQVDYDTSVTRTAPEAFAARSGNCLSLVILTGAFAKALHVPVQYQAVPGVGTWSRSSGIAFHSGHVNVRLGGSTLDRRSGHELVVDYLPESSSAHRAERPISEQTVVAMYLNNRAAETMADGDLDLSYAYAQAALLRSPGFTVAYNTLGVIYLRHGDPALAERALRAALTREPADVQVIDNLIAAVQAQGRDAEAAALRAKLAALQPYPPFYFMDQGMAALSRGDDRAALDLFGQELKRMPYDDEVHFALAVVKMRLGDLRGARAQMMLALENSTTETRHNIYAAKLAHLKALEPKPQPRR